MIKYSLLFVSLILGKLVYSQQPQLILPNNGISNPEVSSDGERIICRAYQNSSVWDFKSGLLLIPDVAKRMNSKIAFLSPDAKFAFVMTDDSIPTLRDINTGNIITTYNFKRSPNSDLNVYFSPDSKILATSFDDKNIILWHAKTGTIICKIKTSITHFSELIFSPDRKMIAVSHSYSYCPVKTQIFSTITGELKVEVDGRISRNTSSCFSPNGNLIVTMGCTQDLKKLTPGERYFGASKEDSKNDATARIWEIRSGKLLRVLKEFDSSTWIGNAVFNPKGDKIVTNSYEGVKVWETSTGKLLHAIKQNQIGFTESTPVFFKNLILINAATAIKIINIETGKTEEPISVRSETIGTMRFAYKNYLIIGGNLMEIVDINLKRSIKQIRQHSIGSTCKPLDCDLLIYTNQPALHNSFSVPVHNPLFDLDAASLAGVVKFTCVSQFTAAPDTSLYKECFKREGDYFFNNCITIPPVFKKEYIELSQKNDSSFLKKIFDILPPAFEESFGYCNGVSFNSFGTIHPYSRDGTKLLIPENLLINSKENVSLGYSKLKICNTSDGQLISTISIPKRYQSAAFNYDGKKIITIIDSNASVWDAEKCLNLFDLPKHNSKISMAAFSPDGMNLVTCSDDGNMKIWDLNTGYLKKNLLTGNYVRFNQDGKLLATYFQGVEQFMVWETETYKLLSILPGRFLSFSSDNKKLLTLEKKQIKVRAISNGDSLSTLGHNEIYGSGIFMKNNEKVVTGSSDLNSVFKTATGELLYKFLIIDTSDFFCIVPSGYYRSSTEATKLLHYVTRDLKVFSFDQLDIKYNRPDKVLEAIGNTDTALIRSYKRAYEKRIQRLGIDTSAFQDGYSVPEADFANRENVEYEQPSEKIQLAIKAVDSTYPLDRYNVWVNGAPLFGRNGRSIRNSKEKVFSGSVTVPLSDGENRIETSVINANGTESYRSPMYVKYTPGMPATEKLHFIGIGIDRFADSTYNLKYSVKDIRDLSRRLKKKYGDKITIDTLFDENVTVSNVRSLRKKLEQTSVNDKVIVSYSGHGLLSKDFDYYLSTYAVNFDSAKQNGLPYDELEDLIDSIPARKKLVLVDACHSGEVDKEELQRLNAVADSLHLKRGIKPVAYKKDEAHLGMKNSFELMQQLFVNVDKNTGATVISAAGGTQFALERGDLQNGVFTFSILEYMLTHEHATVNELKQYVNRRVPELTGGLQQPTTRAENIESDWSVW